MYPEINKLISLLHARKMSTYLVTNAQFPDAIRTLSPVTQLYVSVDASNKASLKKIDRPLFRDFWERFNDSLLALSEKASPSLETNLREQYILNDGLLAGPTNGLSADIGEDVQHYGNRSLRQSGQLRKTRLHRGQGTFQCVLSIESSEYSPRYRGFL